MRNCHTPFFLGILSAAATHGQIAPSPESQAPAGPTPESRPASFYASSAAPVTSALVHEQAAAFWGTKPLEGLNLLQWGPFQVRPSANYRFTYGNGINANPGQQEATAVHQITPAAALVSPHLSFNYAPSLSYYSSAAFKDTIDHTASAHANLAVGDWGFSLAHSFSKTSSPLIETATQTRQQSHSTILSAHYQHSQEISLDLNLSQSIQKAEALNNSRSWSSMNWLNYHLSEYMLVGAGLGGGYTEQEIGSNSTHEQVQGRVGWKPSEKLNLNLNGGIEIRQFLDGEIEDQVNPIMGASVNYTPWEATSFSLSANKGVSTSVLQAQATENTTLSAGLRQRLLGKLNLDLFGSLVTTDYQEIQGEFNPEGSRSDEVLSFSASLGARFLNKGDVSIFYQRSQNKSSAEAFSFNSNQYGFQIGYRF